MHARVKTLPICCKQHDDGTLCGKLLQTDALPASNLHYSFGGRPPGSLTSYPGRMCYY